ncbi:MAG: hypothetical protein LAO77_07795 [Acidobacteriia bacterium]|nr:hypothetical protein [Terriglobia bacterium]
MTKVPAAQRAAIVLSTASVALCFGGSVYAVHVVLTNAHALPGFTAWMAVPVAARSWFTAITAPLWLIAGAASMAVMFLAADIIRQANGYGLVVTHAPAVISGSRLFAAGALAIAIAHAGRWIWRRRESG